MNVSVKSCKNCLILWKRTKTHRFGENYATFSNKIPCSGVSMNFWAKDCKKWLNSWKKHEKSWIWPKLCNFSRKLPCLCISINFSGKSCKKCLISWKSTKNHRFGQIFITFRTNYHVFAFRWTFQERLQKVPHFLKTHEKSSISSKVCKFSNKLPCLCISMNFSEKVAKSASFREKAREIIDFAKTCHFSKKLPCFYVSMNFMEKPPHFVKKHENSSIWPKLCNFFEQTIMFWRFDKLFSKRLQKVA